MQVLERGTIKSTSIGYQARKWSSRPRLEVASQATFIIIHESCNVTYHVEYFCIVRDLLLVLIYSGGYYCNAPLVVGRRTADGAIMLLLAAMRGLVSQVS